MDKSTIVNHETLELLVTGTGAGATMAYDGEPSSGFLIRLKNQLLLQCDLGLGTLAAVRRFARTALSPNIYISHNHVDHSGELAIALAVESKGRDHQLTVYAEPEVMRRLKEYRLHELLSTGRVLEDFATFVETPEGAPCCVAGSDLVIIPHRARHSETAYGLVIAHDDEPLVGWTSDSGFDADLYKTLVRSGAKHLILDARFQDTPEHASFEVVRHWATYELPKIHFELFGASRALPRVWLTGYGTQGEVLPDEMLAPCKALHPGDILELKEGVEVVHRIGATTADAEESNFGPDQGGNETAGTSTGAARASLKNRVTSFQTATTTLHDAF